MSGVRRFAAVIGGLVLAVGGVGLAASIAIADPEVDRVLRDPRITESSGLAVSANHPGVLYTHNDSDDAPRVFAVGEDGATQATLMLRGAIARDWEGMSPGKRGTDTVWVGDIGDNIDGWASYRVYRFSEPAKLQDRLVSWKVFELRYPGGDSNDAETLMVHPVTGRLYVVTKSVMGGALYVAPETLSETEPNVLRRVSDSLSFATDGAFAPDGSLFAVRGYVSAKVYRTDAPAKAIATIDLPAQPQGESLAWSADGRSLLAGSEGTNSKINRVPLPAKVLAALDLDPLDAGVATNGGSGEGAEGGSGDGPVVGPTGPDPASGEGAGLPREQLLWLGLGAIVLIALGLSLRAWSRQSP